MANLEKLVCSWNGLPGGAGNTVIYWNAGNAAVVRPAWITFVNSWVSALPPSVSVVVPPNGEVIDETNGKMVNTWAVGTAATITGAATATAYSPTTGMQCKWVTAGFQNGRAVRGRTFIVPASAGVYTSGGLITASFANTVQAGANTFLTGVAPQFVVWSRPLYDRTTTPPTLQRVGKAYPVNTAIVPTKVVSLRGRRDT